MLVWLPCVEEEIEHSHSAKFLTTFSCCAEIRGECQAQAWKASARRFLRFVAVVYLGVVVVVVVVVEDVFFGIVVVVALVAVVAEIGLTTAAGGLVVVTGVFIAALRNCVRFQNFALQNRQRTTVPKVYSCLSNTLLSDFAATQSNGQSRYIA